MVDYCAGDISSEEAAEIIKTVQAHFGNAEFAFHPGVSYRHCMVWHGGKLELGHMTPPHDISGRVVGEHLSRHPDAVRLIAMMEESYALLKDHPSTLPASPRANALPTASGFGAKAASPCFPPLKRPTA